MSSKSFFAALVVLLLAHQPTQARETVGGQASTAQATPQETDNSDVRHCKDHHTNATREVTSTGIELKGTINFKNKNTFSIAKGAECSPPVKSGATSCKVCMPNGGKAPARLPFNGQFKANTASAVDGATAISFEGKKNPRLKYDIRCDSAARATLADVCSSLGALEIDLHHAGPKNGQQRADLQVGGDELDARKDPEGKGGSRPRPRNGR